MKLSKETVLFADDNIIRVGDIVSINGNVIVGKVRNIYTSSYDFKDTISIDTSTQYDSNIINIDINNIKTIEKSESMEDN